MTTLKLLLYAAFLYLLRFYGIGLLEQFTFFNAMHQPLQDHPDCFGFTEADFPLSHLFNYLLWCSVVLLFHLSHKNIQLPMLGKSLLLYGLCLLFFVSLSGIFMNHFNSGIRVFYRYIMLDAVLVFGVLGIINGLTYPIIFKERLN